ncbi:MAG: hypothetical protein IPO21_17055 [Bacteroidales bacterium]|nr:hypothetical protein [Bacteroidales bacterium]
MKKSILSLTITSFVLGLILVGCETPTEKVKNAQEDALDAKVEVIDAKQDLKNNIRFCCRLSTV